MRSERCRKSQRSSGLDIGREPVSSIISGLWDQRHRGRWALEGCDLLATLELLRICDGLATHNPYFDGQETRDGCWSDVASRTLSLPLRLEYSARARRIPAHST